MEKCPLLCFLPAHAPQSRSQWYRFCALFGEVPGSKSLWLTRAVPKTIPQHVCSIHSLEMCPETRLKSLSFNSLKVNATFTRNAIVPKMAETTSLRIHFLIYIYNAQIKCISWTEEVQTLELVRPTGSHGNAVQLLLGGSNHGAEFVWDEKGLGIWSTLR